MKSHKNLMVELRASRTKLYKSSDLGEMGNHRWFLSRCVIESELYFWKVCLAGVVGRTQRKNRRPFLRPLWLSKREAWKPKWGREYWE